MNPHLPMDPQTPKGLLEDKHTFKTALKWSQTTDWIQIRMIDGLIIDKQASNLLQNPQNSSKNSLKFTVFERKP